MPKSSLFNTFDRILKRAVLDSYPIHSLRPHICNDTNGSWVGFEIYSTTIRTWESTNN